MLYCVFDTSTQYLFLSQFSSSLVTSGFKSQVRNREPLTLKLPNSSYSDCIYILYTINVQENSIANKLTMLAVVTSNILHARNMHLLFTEPQSTKIIPPTLYFLFNLFFFLTCGIYVHPYKLISVLMSVNRNRSRLQRSSFLW